MDLRKCSIWYPLIKTIVRWKITIPEAVWTGKRFERCRLEKNVANWAAAPNFPWPGVAVDLRGVTD